MSGCNCDPETVFELAEGALSPERESEVREHLARCPGCRDLYEKELDLSAFLLSAEFSGLQREQGASVCRGVAMSLPTRPLRARLLLGFGALALLLTTLLALQVFGVRPAMYTLDALSTGWGFVSGMAEVVEVTLSVAGPVLLLVLAAGALLDLLVVSVVLSIFNRSRQQARRA